MSSTPAPREATRLGELTSRQWKSGIAAWLGWLFDGLELHLYTLVAAPLVMQLLHATSSADPAVKEKRKRGPPPERRDPASMQKRLSSPSSASA